MKIPASAVADVTPVDKAHFAEVRDQWIRPSHDLTGLRLLREKAVRERDSRELYRNRAPYELLQNADDAGARRAVFLLTSEGLCFAHSGKWFSVANLKSLAEGWSDKDPQQCIGHKGLGFRSVLDITPAPHAVSLEGREFFGFKFTWALNNGHIQETLRASSALEDEYRKWIAHGQSACPVMAIPGEARLVSMGAGAEIYKDLTRGAYGPGLTTMFWLPAKDADADPKVVAEMGVCPFTSDPASRNRLVAFVENDVAVFLPFLSCLEAVSLYIDGKLLASAASSGSRRSAVGDEVRVEVVAGRRRHAGTFFQLHSESTIPPHVKGDAQTPLAVKQMNRAAFTLSVRLNEGRPEFNASARFHVYFPTEEPTGFGFTVHGDFFVKPDRTRLMGGAYNKWLLGLVASKCAGDFLTQLLKRYSAKAVFESLRPSAAISREAEVLFHQLAATALKNRPTPFIPGTPGTLRPDEVALPTSADPAGFWTEMFADSVAIVTKKTAFLDPAADSDDARSFLALAEVRPLRDDTILDLLEDRAKTARTADWWYKAYAFLATNKATASWSHERVAGRRILPDQDFAVIAIPTGDHPVLCLPPTDDASALKVPQSFTSSFVFVNSSLGERLRSGSQVVHRWLSNACQIVPFEATELLPRAIAATVQKFFDGTEAVTARDIALIWEFVDKIIALSRGITSDQFWQAIGRLPIPSTFDPTSTEPAPAVDMAPAFLCYWPDGDPEGAACLRGVDGYRRVPAEFLSFLLSAVGGTEDHWRSLLRQAGVSGAPKRLRYVRPIGGGREVAFASRIGDETGGSGFSGERQRDENLVVLENLRESPLWREHIESFGAAERSGRTLQEVRVLDRLEACVAAAEAALTRGEADWGERLWSLVRSIPIDDANGISSDQVFQRSAPRGGANTVVRSFLRVQLDRLHWAPSSLGPVSPRGGFLRFSNRRLVSRGAGEEELGDRLVPYVVAETLDDYGRLGRLGFEILEDAQADPRTVVRFLGMVGERLSEAAARESVVGVRSRWRLVRGAIQECYRALNQAETVPNLPPDIRFAAQTSAGVEFRTRPLYYAERGSALERAFSDVLPMFDADRAQKALFEELGIRRLTVGESVAEEFSIEARCAPSSSLRQSIVNDLGPYLLSVVIAKSEEKGHRELVLRRLRERFDVQVADRLTVKFTLSAYDGQEAIERESDFPKFYLRRRKGEGAGAVQEYHYTLYVVGRDDIDLRALDGDALGDALAPVFFDGMRDELAPLFPRIVSRFQSVSGSPSEMERFLFESLGVSLEAQELARDDIAGRQEDAPPIVVPPPPATIIGPSLQADLPGGSSEDARLDEHVEEASKRLERLMKGLTKGAESGADGEGGLSASHSGGSGRPTREQEVRGRRGEEEFLRRIGQPGGWMGFTLHTDTRSDATGYDFVCMQGGREVMVEVKTFAQDGRVLVSANELQAAARYRGDYYLVGFLDDGQDSQWGSSIARDPLTLLLENGKFDVDVKLQAKAADVFGGGGRASV